MSTVAVLVGCAERNPLAPLRVKWRSFGRQKAYDRAKRQALVEDEFCGRAKTRDAPGLIIVWHERAIFESVLSSDLSAEPS